MPLNTKEKLIKAIRARRGSTPPFIDFYVDLNGRYIAKGYGGLGTTDYHTLSESNKLTRFLAELEHEGRLARGHFKPIYELGLEEAAELTWIENQLDTTSHEAPTLSSNLKKTL